MVESHEASELPELSDDVDGMTLEDIGNLQLGDTDTDALRTVFMWKSVAAENVRELDDTPELPAEFAEYSISELKATPLSAASTNEVKLRLLEYYVSEELL